MACPTGTRTCSAKFSRSDRPVPPVYAPTGSLMASAEDLAHYAIAHLDDGRYGDAAISRQRA